MKFLFAVAILFLSGCVSFPKYTREYKPIDAKDYTYQAKNIKMTYLPVTDKTHIPVIFENLSSSAIKIIWAESTFIGVDGNTQPIIHNGVNLMTRNQAPLPPSVIPAKAKLEDAVVPSGHISFTSYWKYEAICGIINHYEGDATCVGKPITLVFVYELDGKKTSFTVKYQLDKREKIDSKKK